MLIYDRIYRVDMGITIHAHGTAPLSNVETKCSRQLGKLKTMLAYQHQGVMMGIIRLASALTQMLPGMFPIFFVT